MLGIVALIALTVAGGIFLTYAVYVTFMWLKEKIKEKLAKSNTKKVAVADMDELIESCDNTVTLDQLEKLHDEGYTHMIATVNTDGKVDDVEVVKDKSDIEDSEVAQFINRTGEGMVVVTK